MDLVNFGFIPLGVKLFCDKKLFNSWKYFKAYIII